MGFAGAYALRVGAGMDITDQARFGIAPERLYPAEIALLMEAELGSETGDFDLACSGLRSACVREILESRLTHYQPDGTVIQDGRVDYLIHWRDLAQHIKSLGLEPIEGGALWSWVTGPIAGDSDRLAAMQLLRKEVQAKFREYWQAHPNAKIEGKSGVIDGVGKPYLDAHQCTRKTLRTWAKEIAPTSATKPGRPRKTAK